MLLLNGSINVLELLNAMYQLATPYNLISIGQLERNIVVQDGFNKTICFKELKVVLSQYITINNVFVMVLLLKTTSTRLDVPTLAILLLQCQQKVDYATMYCWLLHCSYKRLIAILKELGITYSLKEYASFNCKACYAIKEKMKVS